MDVDAPYGYTTTTVECVTTNETTLFALIISQGRYDYNHKRRENTRSTRLAYTKYHYDRPENVDVKFSMDSSLGTWFTANDLAAFWFYVYTYVPKYIPKANDLVHRTFAVSENVWNGRGETING